MYRIALYTSRITFPLSFARHSWVVLESPEYGCNRYEIHAFINPKTKDHLYHNNQPEKEGMTVFSVLSYWLSSMKFQSKKIYEVQGESYKESIHMLEKEIQAYPYRKKYIMFPGPNSNTFTRWVIKKAGLEKTVLLPWNAFSFL